MSGWNVLVACLVSSCGILSFLRTVACAVDAAEGAVRGHEERQKRERKPSAGN